MTDMTEKADPGSVEPILNRGAARILLLMTGRAVELDGCLVPTALRLDSIGKAAFEHYDGNETGTLSGTIEEITGVPSVVHASTIKKIVDSAIIEHAIQLGMPPAETAQMAV